MKIQLEGLDVAFIVSYFVAIFAIAMKVTRSSKKSSSDYFLAGRNLSWFVVGASLFSSNIGSEHLIGLAGAGASTGVAVAQFEILAGFILLLLGWVFVPFYIQSGVHTMPEFLQLRYGSWARNYLSIVSIIAYVITKISVTIFAAAVVFEVLGIDFWLGAFLVVFATGLYTVLGGLRAIVYTEILQLFVMIGGALMVTIMGLNAIGGITELRNAVEPEMFNLWKASSDPTFPWTGILFGAPILGVWYWCTDQFIVQRVISASGVKEARKGTLFGAYLKQLPLFVFVLPGIICMALSKKGFLVLDRPDQALPVLLGAVLPSGFKGIALAGLLAALMGSLASVFNSCSTLVTFDLFKRWYPEASEAVLLRVGKLTTVVLVFLGMAWIPLMHLISGTLFTYIQSVQAYIAPPIAAIFLLGILFPRLNAPGATATLVVGSVVGVLRLILEMRKHVLDGFWYEFANINFLHFAFFLFLLSCIVLISVSYVYENLHSIKSKRVDVENLCISSANLAVKEQASVRELAFTIGLVGLIFSIWWTFS